MTSDAGASAARSRSMASAPTVFDLFWAQAAHTPSAPAIEWDNRCWSYRDLLDAVDRLSTGLKKRGVATGDRIAIISENRIEYTLLQLAAARMGAIVACLNWRLATEEQQHCIKIAEPKLLFASPRYASAAAMLNAAPLELLSIADCMDTLVDYEPDTAAPHGDSEMGLLLIFTSGTTGLPKAALISHRAEIARMSVLRRDLGIGPEDAYLAWSPMFHMGGTEHSLASLMFGAQVIITDGFDIASMVDAIARVKLGWLLLIPSMIEPLLQQLKKPHTQVKGVKVVGCMADLVPSRQIADLTRTLDAPFLNSFGATETGLPPLSGNLIPIGKTPHAFTKQLSSFCEFRVVDGDDRDVSVGGTGEGLVRGPTLFSGYWRAEEANSTCFRNGWYCMGDLFRRCPEGGYEFVGRSKYLIKSGGENIYPAEIERVLLSDPRIADVVVVRKPDAKWGEIPVAFIARIDEELSALDVEVICRRRLAGYKRPREVHFISLDEFPRSATGKILREHLEQRLASMHGK